MGKRTLGLDPPLSVGLSFRMSMESEPIGGRLFRLITSPWLIAGFVFLVLWFVGRVPDIAIDESLWSYIANLWVRYGVPPYVGAIENKSPGIFEVFALTNLLFGVNYWLPRLLGVLSMAAATLLISYLGRVLHGRLAGAFAGVIFGLMMSWVRMEGYWPAQTESFMVLFTALGFFLLIMDGRTKGIAGHVLVFASGLAAGLAIQFKQVAVFSAAAMFLFILLEFKISLRDKLFCRGGLFLAGVATGVVVMLIPLFLSGVTLWDYIDGAWFILFQGGTAAPMAIRLTKGYNFWFRSEGVLIWVFVFIFIIQFRSFRDAGIPFWGIITWLILDFIGANSSGYYYGHQLKQVIPPVALAGGIGIAQVFRSLVKSGAISPDRFSSRAMLSLGILALVLWGFSSTKTQQEARLDSQKNLGLWLRENTTREDYIYVNTLARGGWAILAYAERRCPSRYFNYMFLSRRGAMEEFSRDMHERKPKFIVDRPGDPWMNISWFQGFLDSNYVLVKTEGDFRIFRLK
ncbi:MAG: ArnT family glycosyltransferase [candidate division WOR-3 bacterium]